MDCSPPGFPVHGDSPGQNTGVGCHSLLQGIFPTQGLNPGLLHSGGGGDSLPSELPGLRSRSKTAGTGLSLFSGSKFKGISDFGHGPSQSVPSWGKHHRDSLGGEEKVSFQALHSCSGKTGRPGFLLLWIRFSPVAQLVKNPPAMPET